LVILGFYIVYVLAMEDKKAVLAVMMLGVLFGCVAMPRTPEQSAISPHPLAPEGFPTHIAVLPLINTTSDSDGPVIVRAFAIRTLSRELGYIVPSADETDQSLAGRDLIWSGHPQGRQLLSKQDPAVLASWLGVEGVMFGDLSAYSRQKVSLYSESKVNVHFWLVDGSGKKVWESKNGSSEGKDFTLGSTPMQNVLGDGSLPADVQDRVRRSEAASPALEAVEAALSDFPKRR
jgi:hypothetical protein